VFEIPVSDGALDGWEADARFEPGDADTQADQPRSAVGSGAVTHGIRSPEITTPRTSGPSLASPLRIRFRNQLQR